MATKEPSVIEIVCKLPTCLMEPENVPLTRPDKSPVTAVLFDNSVIFTDID